MLGGLSAQGVDCRDTRDTVPSQRRQLEMTKAQLSVTHYLCGEW